MAGSASSGALGVKVDWERNLEGVTQLGIGKEGILVKFVPLVMAARYCGLAQAQKWIKQNHALFSECQISDVQWTGEGQPTQPIKSCPVSAVADVLKIAATQKESYAAAKGVGAFMTEQERDGAAQRVRNAGLEVAASHLEAVRGALVGSLGCGEKEIDAKLRDKATAEAKELKSTRASLRAKEDEISRVRQDATLRAETVQGLQKQLAAVFANQPEPINNYFKYTADEMLQMPHTTGDVVPVAFSLHYPVMQEGTAIFQHMGGVLQEDATTETSIEAHHTSTFTFYSLYMSFLAVHSASHFYIHLP
jgi:hypothetical protein